MLYKENTSRFVSQTPLLAEIVQFSQKSSFGLYVVGPAAFRLINDKKCNLLHLACDSDFTALMQHLQAANPALTVEEHEGIYWFFAGESPVYCLSRIRKLRAAKDDVEAAGFPTLKELCLSFGFSIFAIAVSLKRQSSGKPYAYNDALAATESKTSSPHVRVKELQPQHGLYFAAAEAESVSPVNEWLYEQFKQLPVDFKQLHRLLQTGILLQVLSAAKPSRGLIALFHSGYMNSVFPEAAQMAGVEQRKEYHHKDVFFHTCEVVDNLSNASDDVWLRFAALVHDIAKPHTKKFIEGTGWSFHAHDEIGARVIKGVFRRLRLPAERLNYIQKLIRLHLRPAALAKEQVTDSAIRRLITEAGENLKDLMKLCRADITSKNHSKVSRFLRNYDYVERRVLEVSEKDEAAAFQSPVRGAEIMQICNIGPSKLVGKIKTAIESAILSGEIENTYDAAYAYLLKIRSEFLQ